MPIFFIQFFQLLTNTVVIFNFFIHIQSSQGYYYNQLQFTLYYWISPIQFTPVITQLITDSKQQMSKRSISFQNPIIILCLNPKCTEPSQRCLDSRTIRTHPSDCSCHYFSVDTILSKHWTQIPDYPSDALGISVSKKIKTVNSEQKNTLTFYRKLIQNFKTKLDKAIQQFSKKFQEYLPSSSLQDVYFTTYSLQKIIKNLQQGSNPQFITKCINYSYSKSNYGELGSINQKLEDIEAAFENILSGVKTQVKSLLDSIILTSKKQDASSFRFEEGIMKPKIQFGLLKSKFVTSSKIQCNNGQIIFPKLENIVSFLPWLYSDKSFTTGIHEFKITSLKFPSISNAGFTVLEEHDIDTYPYHYFKSLFNKQGKGFKLVSSISQFDSFQSSVALKNNEEKQIKNKTNYTELEHTISQVAEVILRIQLNTNPRAIIRNVEGTSVYVCPLEPGRKYRMGIYGSGWIININQLY